jgi:pimeloyl-ACP methyl ester carboxylesterase
MSETTREAKLDVPGATLHYEVTGSGPVLLLITGAPGDATNFLAWCRSSRRSNTRS